MIVRMWRGAVRPEDAEAYAAYIDETGMAEYGKTAGNRGAYMLRREAGALTEFVTVSMWDDWKAVRAFAGPHPERAVFYPEDDRFLVEREETVTHYDVARSVNL